MFEHLYYGENGAIFKEFDKVLEMIKKNHPDKYKTIKCDIYVAMNGYHFNQETLDKALGEMVNDNGTTSPKWTVAETTQVAQNNNITFDHFNQFDWNYVMNMMYSDYCDVLGETLSSYVKMSKKFLMDKDAPEGKAIRYYWAMH